MGTLVISTGLKLNTSNKQRHWICITIPKGRKEHMVSKYWTKANRKLRGANFKFCIFISDIKTFFISATLFSFFDYSILLSLELALHLFISFPLEVFRDISNILDFIINLGFTYQPLQVSMLGYPLHIPFFFFPTGFLYLWQGFPETLSCIFDSKYWNTNLKLLSIAAC